MASAYLLFPARTWRVRFCSISPGLVVLVGQRGVLGSRAVCWCRRGCGRSLGRRVVGHVKDGENWRKVVG